jgi:AbrB family looped-hinge helix DNA binding protein
MEPTTTLLSTKGQIVLPKAIRESKGWKAGTEFTVEETPQGLLLRPKRQIKRITLAEFEKIIAKYKWKGKPATLKEMDEGIGREIERRHALGRY